MRARCLSEGTAAVDRSARHGRRRRCCGEERRGGGRSIWTGSDRPNDRQRLRSGRATGQVVGSAMPACGSLCPSPHRTGAVSGADAGALPLRATKRPRRRRRRRAAGGVAGSSDPSWRVSATARLPARSHQQASSPSVASGRVALVRREQSLEESMATHRERQKMLRPVDPSDACRPFHGSGGQPASRGLGQQDGSRPRPATEAAAAMGWLFLLEAMSHQPGAGSIALSAALLGEHARSTPDRGRQKRCRLTCSSPR